MRDLKAIVKNLVQYAIITATTDDAGDQQLGQVEAMEKTQNCNFHYPYGLAANAPKNSTVLKFNTGGSSQNPVGIPGNPDNRPKGLEEWEVAVGNFLKKNRVFFDKDGSIVIEVVEPEQSIEIRSELGYIKMDETGKVDINGHLTVEPATP